MPVTPSHEPAEAPLQLQTEQKLDPLTKEDVELYLQVMRTAAARVMELPSADKSTLEAAEKILAAGATGKVPSMRDAKTLARANLIALYMDQIVAEEMKLDELKYRGIAEAIESALPSAKGPSVPATGEPPIPGHSASPLEKRLSEVNASNKKSLETYRPEIERLLAVVRNPANLPK